MPLVFGIQLEVVPGVLYGSFLSQTARKLVTSSTTHLFEPVDSLVVSEIIAWMENAFRLPEVLTARINVNQTYLEREAANFVSFVAFFGLIFLAFFLWHILLD